MTPDQLPGYVVVTILVITLGYIAACAIWPFRACHRCDGLGRHRSPGGRAWRYCRHCKGTGGTLRIGRHIWNHLRNTHDRGTRRR